MNIKIINPDNLNYREMFEKLNWNTVEDKKKADIFCFCGGPDVDPYLYDQQKHPKTYFSQDRDINDLKMFCYARKNKIPMIGICRGAQFLHIMAGGFLNQDVDNHYSSHSIDTSCNRNIRVPSDHHQMMADPNVGTVLAWSTGLAKKREYMKENKTIQNKNKLEIEAMYIPNFNALLTQFHPEYNGHTPCTNYFFELIKRYF